MPGCSGLAMILTWIGALSTVLLADERPSATPGVATVIKKIQDGNRNEKLTALRHLRQAAIDKRLGAMKKTVIDLCAQLLEQNDLALAEAGAEVLGWLDTDAVPPLVKALQSKQPTSQSSAVLALSTIASRHPDHLDKLDVAIPFLAKLLDSENKAVRNNAFYAISRLSSKAIAHMIRKLDAEERFQWVMMKGFVRLANDAVEPLCSALRKGDTTTRRNAAFMLFHISWRAPKTLPVLENKALRPLTEAIEDRDQHVRSRAIETLGRMGSRAKPALDKIIAALKQPDAPVGSIADAAAQIGPALKHFEPLLAATKDIGDVQSMNERERATGALGRAIAAIGAQAVKPTINVLKKQDQLLQMIAMHALLELGTKAAPAVPVLIEKLKKGDPMAPVVLEAIGPKAKDAVPHLIRRLEHDEWRKSRSRFGQFNHRSRTANALAAIGPTAVPALVKALKHKDDLVRAGALLALSKMDEARVPLKAIEPLTRDENPLIRYHAMLVLVHQSLAKEQLIPILQRLEKDPHPLLAKMANRELNRLQKLKE